MKKIIIFLLVLVVVALALLSKKRQSSESESMDVYLDSAPMETRQVEEESYIDAQIEAEAEAFRPSSFMAPMPTSE